MNDVALNTVGEARPVIVVSQCLGFAAVRYNGAIIDAPFVQRLARAADIIEVCPEVGIGLGVPRPPIRMERGRGGIALVQPTTGRDITGDMHGYSDSFLGSLGPVDGFILKARSPSCGTRDVSVFDGDAVVASAPGRFADAVLRWFPDVPVQDELTLRDPGERSDFLARVYASARRRLGLAEGSGPAFPAELLDGWP
ncbi:MAG TPA: 2-thiouracil desulfurase family protein [Longimicrobiales bacterium]